MTALVDEYMLTADVAARFKIDQSTLRTWRKTGGGPRYVKFGRLVRYRRSDVEAWERQQEATS